MRPRPVAFNSVQHFHTTGCSVVFVMRTLNGDKPDSAGPENVDRRKAFVEFVERLSQGVVAMAPAEQDARNSAGDEVSGTSGEPTSGGLQRG